MGKFNDLKIKIDNSQFKHGDIVHHDGLKKVVTGFSAEVNMSEPEDYYGILVVTVDQSTGTVEYFRENELENLTPEVKNEN